MLTPHWHILQRIPPMAISRALLDATTDPDTNRIGFFDGPAALGWATWRVIGDACATATPLEGLWISIEAGALHDMPLEGLINLNGCGV